MENPFYNYMYFYNMNSTETVMSNDFLMKRYSQALVKDNIALPKYTDSLDLAKTTIDNLGAKNMELSNVYLTPKGSPQTLVEDWPYCYEFIFSKSYNKATTTYVGNDYAYNKTYNEIWREEYIKIAIDNTGVILIDWRGPSQISEIINNNVKIKSF